MRISPVNNTKFTGIYKMERYFIKSATEDFIEKNTRVNNNNMAITSLPGDYDNLYILTKDDWRIENEFEDCLKKDRAQYWKVMSLNYLWKNSDIGRQIFEAEAELRNGRVKFVRNREGK